MKWSKVLRKAVENARINGSGNLCVLCEECDRRQVKLGRKKGGCKACPLNQEVFIIEDNKNGISIISFSFGDWRYGSCIALAEQIHRGNIDAEAIVLGIAQTLEDEGD